MTERSAAVRSAWAEGVTYFAVALLITVGIFQVLQGLAAVLDKGFYVAAVGNVFALNVTAWGWIHLVIGIVAVAIGIGLFSGRVWARGAGMGIAVLQANENEFDAGQPWDYVSGSPDVGGHSVIVGGYGPPQGGPLGGDERFITWAAETSFTDEFWQREVDECWAVIWPEHLGSAEFMAGMDLATFSADYAAITGRPFPVPVPLPPPPVPVPPVPDIATPADVALAHALGQWPYMHHVGGNRQAANAVVTWERAKNLGPG